MNRRAEEHGIHNDRKSEAFETPNNLCIMGRRVVDAPFC